MTISKSNPGTDALCLEDPYIRLGPGAKVMNSNLVGNLTIDPYSCFNRCDIDRYVGLGCYSYVSDTTIGRYCTFGSRVSVGAFSHPTNWLSIHEFQYRNTENIYGETILDGVERTTPAPTRTHIGCDVWIGDNAAVRTGVTIGHGAIVGLGAVVVDDVPPYAIMVGNPARILRYRFSEDVIQRLLELQWWDLDIQSLKGIDFSDIEKSIESVRAIKLQLTKE